nr:hypothetical protein [Sphingomonas sp. Y57]
MGIANALYFIAYGSVAILAGAALWRVARAGPTGIRKLRRQGHGIPAMVTGSAKLSDSGSDIEMQAGSVALNCGGAPFKVSETHARSKEVDF